MLQAITVERRFICFLGYILNYMDKNQSNIFIYKKLYRYAGYITR